MKQKTKFFFIAIALLIVFIAVYLYINKNQLSELEPHFELSASELYEAYSENEELANEKYLNKILKVTGTVDQVNIISDNALDPVIEVTDPHLSLKTNDPSGSIFCTFKESFRLDPVPVKKGDVITVKGICMGIILTDVQLRDCLLVKPSGE
ncbi:MAG: OB-fold protein [Bacteroidota bacterium]